MEKSNLPLIVLAGGLGTRLKSAVSHLPKPLAPIGTRPFLEILLAQYYQQGIRNFILSLHHQAELVISLLEKLQSSPSFSGAEFRWVVEPDLLGTGGATKYVIEQLRLSGGTFITNADTWIESGVSSLFEMGTSCIALVSQQNPDRFGHVLLEKDRIVSFKEKTLGISDALINAGLYFLETEKLKSFKQTKFSLEKDFFPELVIGRSLKGVIINTSFIDIGIPKDYFQFCNQFLAHKGSSL